jgi:tetratricopeptide (TPR) repeat protein
VDEQLRWYQAAVAAAPGNAAALNNLGHALAAKGQVEESIECFRKAIEIDPKNARAHNNLGAIFCDVRRDYDGAIDCFQKAVALDPKVALYHANLGNALKGKGQFDEAIASYKKAIELEPKDAKTHSLLGRAQADIGQVDEAIASYRKAIALDPKYTVAHFNLGLALSDNGQLDEAIASHRRAIDLNPKFTAAHNSLGCLLCDRKRDYDGAIACFRKLVELEPTTDVVHSNLGNALLGKGQLDEAIACYKSAIKLDPKSAYAHGGLAEALLDKGRYAQARAAASRALELYPANDPNRSETSRRLQTCERLAKLEGRLPRLLKGEEKPASARESLDVAMMCQHKRRYAAAARFAADAYAADPRLGDDLEVGRRYHAARSAAQAAAGQGEDAAKLDDQERARLRKLALGWLRADLALRTKQLESGKPADRAEVQKMGYWQWDSELSGIRDTAALAKLPSQEQKAFAQLWADVAALLKKAEAPTHREDGADNPDPILSALEDSLKLVKADLGPDHPGTLKIMHNLATPYKDAGRLDLALPLLQDLLALRKARLGPEHFDTLQSMNNLAWAYMETGAARPGRAAVRGDAQAPQGPAQTRPPPHAQRHERPRRGLLVPEATGQVHPPVRGDLEGSGSESRARPPMDDQYQGQPGRELQGRGPAQGGDPAARRSPPGHQEIPSAWLGADAVARRLREGGRGCQVRRLAAGTVDRGPQSAAPGQPATGRLARPDRPDSPAAEEVG